MAQGRSNNRLVVIGGGAAGFFCAVNAARMYPDLQVTILEKSSKVLSKVRVSGGGRCNVTHDCASIAEMIRCYPRGQRLLKKAFHHFFTHDTIAWFRERGVDLKTEADGRMFPVTNDSQTIIDCLIREANKYSVQLLLNADVQQMKVPAPVDETGAHEWTIVLKDGRVLHADFVCVATGGFPKPEQFSWLAALGHRIISPVPSLFTFNIPGDAITSLMGVSVENALVKINGLPYTAQGPVLITHWGFSGPAMLRLSAFAARELADAGWTCTLQVNWLPGEHESGIRTLLHEQRSVQGARKVFNTQPFSLPRRLWEYLLQQAGISADHRWADVPAAAQNRLAKLLCTHSFLVKGKTTFKEEFVTAGGIATEEVNPATMESRIQPGLFFAGEILDVDGITGGYNFQHAWTSGWIAANGIASLAKGRRDQ